jgi:oligoendopeptidase F
VAIYHPDSLSIQAEISQLEGRYREIMRRYDGTPEKPFAYWMERREELNDLMLRLLKLRRALARTSGLPSFLAYRWRELNRLGYSIEDCRSFHRAVENTVVPAIVRLGLLEKLNQPSPSISDMDVVSAGVERILQRVDPAFGDVFHAMRNKDHLDIGSRPNKVHTLEEWFFPGDGMPHVHLITADVGSLLHESGHAMHDYLSFQAHGSMWNLNGPEEFQEFVATSMDMLSWPYYDRANGGLFSAAESIDARRNALRYYLESLSNDVMHDAFEHWVYGDAPDDVTPADLDAKWMELKRRFVPWDNQYANEDEFKTGWQRWTWSLYRIPLYMIAYPMAIVGACQLGRLAEADRPSAIHSYKTALAMGNTRPLPGLFRVVGLDFPFTAEAVDAALQFVVEHAGKT